jgi:hypothetical protein
MKFFNVKYLFILVAFLAFFACKDNAKKNDKPFANCKCGAPEPIFKEGGADAITDRNFTMSPISAIENIVFKNGTELEVVQAGCAEIIQEFTFFYKTDMSAQNDDFWKTKAVEEFNAIASLSPRYQPFGLWATAIKVAAPQLKLGQATELEKDFFVTVDKINDGQGTRLKVILNAKSCEEVKK